MLFHIFLEISFALIAFGKSYTVIPMQENCISRVGLINGLIFPDEIHSVVGEEIYFRITEPVDRQSKCLYRKPGGKDANILNPHKNK